MIDPAMHCSIIRPATMYSVRLSIEEKNTRGKLINFEIVQPFHAHLCQNDSTAEEMEGTNL